MVLIVAIVARKFSQVTRISRYATKKQKELVVKG